MNGSVAVAHSVLTDPAFAKMSELKHAGGCDKTFCNYPNCSDAKSLLLHVEQCSQEQCEFKECAFARLLLDHSNGLHHNLIFCPLCKKQAILKRLHPGKAPRSSGSEEDEEEQDKVKKTDEDDSETDGGLSKARKIARHMIMFPAARRSLRPLPVPRQPPKRAFMMELLHSNKCQKESCPESHCAHTKRVLRHIKECTDWESCYYPGCVVGLGLMRHYRACKPVVRKCAICDKQPPPQYKGEDEISRMPSLVLRTIFREMGMHSRDLLPVTQVNRRFREFLRDEKELRGLCKKETYEWLTIEQVGDGAVCFHFAHMDHSGGHFYVISTIGASVEETIYYDTKRSVAAKAHISAKYPRCADAAAPIRIPAEFYDELSLAMLKNDFMSIELRNVIIDFDFFDFFIAAMNDIHPLSREFRHKNLRIETSEALTKAVSEDFEAVLDVCSVKHLCKEEHKERIEKKKKEAEKKAKAVAKLKKKNKKKKGGDKAGTSSTSKEIKNENGDEEKAETTAKSKNDNKIENGDEDKAGPSNICKEQRKRENGKAEKAGTSNESKDKKKMKNGDEDKPGTSDETKKEKKKEGGDEAGPSGTCKDEEKKEDEDENEDVFPCGCDMYGFFTGSEVVDEPEAKKAKQA